MAVRRCARVGDDICDGARSRSRIARGSALTQFGEQPQDFEVEPHEGDQQGKPAVPLHVFGGALLGPTLDAVEVEQQVEGRDGNDDHAEPDAHGAAAVQKRHADAEQPQHHGGDVEQEDAAGGHHDAGPQFGGDGDDAEGVEDQHGRGHAEGEAHRLNDDAVDGEAVLRGVAADGGLVVHVRHAAEEEPLEGGVDRRGGGRPGRLEDGDQRGDEARDSAAEDQDGGVGRPGIGRPPGETGADHTDTEQGERFVHRALNCHRIGLNETTGRAEGIGRKGGVAAEHGCSSSGERVDERKNTHRRCDHESKQKAFAI